MRIFSDLLTGYVKGDELDNENEENKNYARDYYLRYKKFIYSPLVHFFYDTVFIILKNIFLNFL